MKLVLEKGQRLFFTSDTHYNHANICTATTTWVGAENLTRKFNTLNHMNDTLVNNINELVGENDVLIHLGDWSFGGFEKISEFRNRIICKNIHLTYGNHDHHIHNNKEDIQEIFSTTQDYLFLDVGSLEQVLVPSDVIADKVHFLKEGTEVKAVFYGETVFSVELPQFLEIMVVKTETAQASNPMGNTIKTAFLETGAKLDVPLFVESGDIIKVDTHTREYVQRV